MFWPQVDDSAGGAKCNWLTVWRVSVDQRCNQVVALADGMHISGTCGKDWSSCAGQAHCKVSAKWQVYTFQGWQCVNHVRLLRILGDDIRKNAPFAVTRARLVLRALP